MADLSTTFSNCTRTAKAYSNLNDLQLRFGKELVALLDVKPGEKVLDMGCGTGELTTYIADQVGEEGQVFGVDPDNERIKVATQKHLHERQSNIGFVTGDSSSDFPHFNEEYYDIYISNFVFHWLTSEEKAVYINSAIKCLKPGGRIAIRSLEREPDACLDVQKLFPDNEIKNTDKPCPGYYYVKKTTVESMLVEAGFVLLSSEFDKRGHTFPSVDWFLTWFCASDLLNENKIVPAKRKAFAEKYTCEDGTVQLETMLYHIIAKK